MPTALLILELLLRYGPAVAEAAQQIISKNDPTPDDWQKLFAIASKPYDKYIEEAKKRAGV